MHVKIFELAKTIEQGAQFLEHHKQYTVVLSNKSNITTLLKALKENETTSFDMLVDITAIDWAREHNRFEIVYFLYSNKNKFRIRVKVQIEESDCFVYTVENIYPSANWYEREVWDMYGIKFEGHSDMRRFYMPEDFYDSKTGVTYHPLRKDFPLTGVPDSLPLPPFPERFGEEIKF